MENNDFKLDDFLRKKVENAHIPINEMHWEDALRRLDDGEESKKGGFLFWSVLILFISLASLGTYLFFPKNNKKAIVKNETNNTQIKNNNEDIIETNDETLQSKKNIDSNRNVQNETVKNINEYEKVTSGKKQEKENNVAINNQNNANILISKKDIENNNSSINEKNTDLTQNIKLPKNNNNNFENNEKLLGDEKNNVVNSAKLNNKKTKNKKPETLKNNTEHKANAEKDELIVDKNYTVKPIAEQVKKQEPKKINPASLSALNPRYVKGLENYTSIKKNDTVELSTAQIENLIAKNNKDTTISRNVTSIKKPIKIIEKSKAGFFTDVQLNYSKGFKKSSNSYNANSNPVLNPITTNDPIKWSISPYVGIGYCFPISNRFDFFGSLAWTMQNNLNINDYSYQVKYGFGKDSTSMIVNRKSQIQLEMPLQIGFKINNSNMLIGGFGLNYGLDVYSSVKDFETESFKNQFGFRSGINTIDLIAMFGYAYKINNNILLQANYSKGFIDKTNNTYFNNLNKDNTQRFSIGMKYLFNKKK